MKRTMAGRKPRRWAVFPPAHRSTASSICSAMSGNGQRPRTAAYDGSHAEKKRVLRGEVGAVASPRTERTSPPFRLVPTSRAQFLASAAPDETGCEKSGALTARLMHNSRTDMRPVSRSLSHAMGSYLRRIACTGVPWPRSWCSFPSSTPPISSIPSSYQTHHRPLHSRASPRLDLRHPGVVALLGVLNYFCHRAYTVCETTINQGRVARPAQSDHRETPDPVVCSITPAMRAGVSSRSCCRRGANRAFCRDALQYTAGV